MFNLILEKKIEYCFLEKYSHFKETEAEKKLNWELLFSKMDSMNLTKAEKELIRYDILHNEAIYRRKKFLFSHFILYLN